MCCCTLLLFVYYTTVIFSDQYTGLLLQDIWVVSNLWAKNLARQPPIYATLSACLFRVNAVQTFVSVAKLLSTGH